MASDKALSHRRRIGGLLASGRLPWDYREETVTPEQRKEVADRSWGQDGPKAPPRAIDPVWPLDYLERVMLVDADHAVRAGADVGYHVRGLLARVRDLEKECERLRVFEAAMRALAAEIVHPKTTAEQMAAEILKAGG